MSTPVLRDRSLRLVLFRCLLVSSRLFWPFSASVAPLPRLCEKKVPSAVTTGLSRGLNCRGGASEERLLCRSHRTPRGEPDEVCERDPERMAGD